MSTAPRRLSSAPQTHDPGSAAGEMGSCATRRRLSARHPDQRARCARPLTTATTPLRLVASRRARTLLRARARYASSINISVPIAPSAVIVNMTAFGGRRRSASSASAVESKPERSSSCRTVGNENLSSIRS